MNETRVTLKLTRSKSPAILLALTLFAALCALGEMAGRSALVQDRVPYQAHGTNHTQMEIQLTNLDAFVRENGAPDCFIFGSSQAFRDVDAVALSEAIQSAGGGDLTCYNFGVTGSQVSTTAVLNQILIKEYHPRLVIIGTSFLDYTEGRELQIDERFIKNEWLKYKTGGFSISGWLTEHSYAWRSLTLLSYSAPYQMDISEVLREAHKWDGEIAPSGFALSNVKINPRIPADDGFVKNLLLEFGGFGVSVRNLSALEQIIMDSQSVGAKIIVVEMPYHPSLLDLNDRHGNPRVDRQSILSFQEKVNSQIADIAAAHDAAFLKTDPSLRIPENVWFDLYHLNRDGANLFGRWIGTQAAQIAEALIAAAGQ